MIISNIITLLFILFLIVRTINTECFSLLDYFVAFGSLFSNLGINILAAIGR